MKPQLRREEWIALGAGVVLVLGAGLLGWWGLGGLAEGMERAQDLLQRKGNADLTAILNNAGGIVAAKKDANEIGKLGLELGQLEEKIAGPWRRGLEEASGQGLDWSKDPGRWKDKLVSDTDDIFKKCGRSGELNSVTVGEKFYLGLEEYKQKSPIAEQVPTLARHLSVAKKLVDLLVLAKKTPEGYVTPCVLLELEVPPINDAGNPDAKKANKELEDKKGSLLREQYRLKMSCSPEVLYEYVNLLCQDPWLFIITNLSLVNERESFPRRGEIAKLFEVDPATTPLNTSEEVPRGKVNETDQSKLLLVLSGKEKVEVDLDVDYIGWGSPPQTGKGQEPKP